jgi:hypothetical protein
MRSTRSQRSASPFLGAPHRNGRGCRLLPPAAAPAIAPRRRERRYFLGRLTGTGAAADFCRRKVPRSARTPRQPRLRPDVTTPLSRGVCDGVCDVFRASRRDAHGIPMSANSVASVRPISIEGLRRRRWTACLDRAAPSASLDRSWIEGLRRRRWTACLDRAAPWHHRTHASRVGPRTSILPARPIRSLPIQLRGTRLYFRPTPPCIQPFEHYKTQVRCRRE